MYIKKGVYEIQRKRRGFFHAVLAWKNYTEVKQKHPP